MAEKKLINLDALIDDGQEVLFDGKTYILHDASLMQLLTFVRKAQDENVTDIERVAMIIELLYELCPEAKPGCDFDNMKMPQVMYIFNHFVMGNVDESVTKAVEAHANQETDEAKKK